MIDLMWFLLTVSSAFGSGFFFGLLRGRDEIRKQWSAHTAVLKYVYPHIDIG